MRDVERADKNENTTQRKKQMTDRIKGLREEAVSGMKSPLNSQSSQSSIGQSIKKPEEHKTLPPRRRNSSNSESLKVMAFKVAP